MTSVPFEDIGPGQKARLAWQIIGMNGPVDNPRGIRYLSPGDVALNESIRLSALQDVATALSGANMLLTTGTLAVSVATLAEVRKISAKVDTMLAVQRVTNERLEAISKKLDAIAIKVGEGRLATIVENALQAAAHGEQLSFQPFAELAHDLEGFLSDAGVVKGTPAVLRLGSDLRKSLKQICYVLRGVRLHAARCYNRSSDSAEQVWRCHPDEDYWSNAEEAQAFGAAMSLTQQVRALSVAAGKVHRAVDKAFSMNNGDDHNAIQAAINESLVCTLVSIGAQENEARDKVMSVHNSLTSADEGGKIPFLSTQFRDKYATAILGAVREAATHASPSGFYPHSVIDAVATNTDDALQLQRGWRAFWLHETDVGLVYRTYRECLGVNSGYTAAFPTTPSRLVLSEQTSPTRALPAELAALPAVFVDLDSIDGALKEQAVAGLR